MTKCKPRPALRERPGLRRLRQQAVEVVEAVEVDTEVGTLMPNGGLFTFIRQNAAPVEF